MTRSEEARAEFDGPVDGKIRVAHRPEGTRIRGRVAYPVHRGEYSGLARVGSDFPEKATQNGEPDGPSGDIYLCSPMDHPRPGAARRLTLFYLPLK